MSRAPLHAAVLVIALALAAALGAQPAPLPPISWTCPMHPDIVEAQKGQCPICKMDLKPVRLDSIWSCPVHSVVAENAPGKCPICRRDLVAVTVAVSWICADRPEVEYLEPGACAKGAPRVVKHAPRAHGNHNPQHGGIFFMAADNWHHLEGTYPDQGVFRLHLYDDYSRPLAPDKVKQVRGRVVTKETFDSATRTTTDVTSYDLALAPGTQYLEAHVDPLAPPAQMTAKVRFEPDGPEYRFDFSFPALSKEPTLDASALAASGIDPSQIPIEVPDKAADVIVELRRRNEQIQSIIARGTFGDLYVPALQAKDLALALDVHARALSPDKRERAASAIKQIVLGAWRLDSFGDQGDRRQIENVYTAFSAAVTDLVALFGAAPSR